MYCRLRCKRVVMIAAVETLTSLSSSLFSNYLSQSDDLKGVLARFSTLKVW